MTKQDMKTGNSPNLLNNKAEEIGDAFVAGRIWQQMVDGIITIKPVGSVRPEAMQLIYDIACAGDYEIERTDLDDGLVDLVLTRIG